MFGSKKSKEENSLYSEQDSRDGQYTQEYEYRTVLIGSIDDIDVQLNAYAKRGWELVNAQSSTATTSLYFAYLRRSLKAAVPR